MALAVDKMGSFGAHEMVLRSCGSSYREDKSAEDG